MSSKDPESQSQKSRITHREANDQIPGEKNKRRKDARSERSTELSLKASTQRQLEELQALRDTRTQQRQPDLASSGRRSDRFAGNNVVGGRDELAKLQHEVKQLKSEKEPAQKWKEMEVSVAGSKIAKVVRINGQMHRVK